MSQALKIGLGGLGVLFVLTIFGVLSWTVFGIVLAAAIAVPAIAYLMLDPSQRRRLRRINNRRQIGR